MASTTIVIPGREDVTIQGATMTAADVIAAYAGTVSLSGMESSVTTSGDVTTVTFANKVGTKGNNDLYAAIFNNLPSAIASASAEVSVDTSDFSVEPAAFAVDEPVSISNTRIVIPGREDQVLSGIVMDATMIRNSFSGTLDLSSYDVEETEEGDTLIVEFRARTGTKGAGDIIINVAGDIVIDNTKIVIPGREDVSVPGALTPQDVIAAFAGDIELGGLDYGFEDVDTLRTITFANKVGTKG